VAVFPSTITGDDPRHGMLSADQIKNIFHERGWHKDFYKGLCDESEAAGKIKATRAVRYNQVLRGLPAVVDAYEKRVAEKDSIMEDVPLSKPARRGKKRRKKRQSSSRPQ